MDPIEPSREIGSPPSKWAAAQQWRRAQSAESVLPAQLEPPDAGLPSPPKRRSLLRLILLLSGSVFLSVFHGRFILVVLENDINFEEARWGLVAHWIASGVLFVPMGWLADRVGRKRTFLIGMPVFAGGLTGIALVSGWKLLTLMGVISSIGNAAVTTAGLALLLAAVPVQRRSTAVGGFYAMFVVVALASAMTIGGMDDVDLKWMIPLYIAVGVVTILWGRRELVESGQLDGAEEKSHQSDVSVLIESASTSRTPTSESFWSRNMLLANFSGFAFVGGIGLNALANSLYRDNIWIDDLSVGRVLTLLLVGVIGSFALPCLAGKLADRKGHREMIMISATFLLIHSLISAIVTNGRDIVLVTWVGSVVLFVLGFGVGFAIIEGAAVKTLPLSRLGTGVGFHHFLRYLGSTVTICLYVLVDWKVSGNILEQRWMFGLGAIFAAGAIALALGIDTRPASRLNGQDEGSTEVK